jgi:predicted nucleic acid-binding protein
MRSPTGSTMLISAFISHISPTSKWPRSFAGSCAAESSMRGERRVRFADLRDLDLERHPHEPLLDRVWLLRENFTAYDAVYVALAEALETKLLTCDERIARAPGMSRRVKLVG